MIRLDHREPVPEALRGAILALGNFDGFHLGHQAVVGEAIAWARTEARPCIVATFDPHPMRHFKPDTEPFRLTTLDQREELFAAAGADAMLVFHFDGAMASESAEQWADGMIKGHIGAADAGGGDANRRRGA
jgi:riboflavin kinase / FMN adenylyltransferase